jgi:hypothetical protein
LQTSFGDVSSQTSIVSGPFSLTEGITINHPGGFSSAFGKTLSANAVPIPGALLLLGSGLLGLIGIGRRFQH